MKKSFVLMGILALLMLLTVDYSYAKNNDTLQTDTSSVELDTKITVLGTCLSRSTTEFPNDKTRFSDVLKTDGFGIVKKGVFLAQDVYMSGFKRSDIELVIDGERYYCACPNRMDSPLSRTNSLEMKSITLNKTSAPLQSGLGGNISFIREEPVYSKLLRVGIAQSFNASETSDFGFILNSNQHRISGRYARGKGYEDANGNSFVDLYGFKENYSYYLVEGALTGLYKDYLYRAELTYSEDIMFPYLLMDERDNMFLSTSIKYKDHKLYLNYTTHLMDNGLRKSSMFMETDATNLTVGLTGNSYEVYYRHWNADNQIVTPMMEINNHLTPDVGKFSAVVHHQHSYNFINMWGELVSLFSAQA